MKKRNKRFTCLLLVVCMLMSVLTLPVSAAESVSPDADKDKAVFIEAERGKMSKKTNTFEVVKDKTASGKKYIMSTATGAKLADPDSMDPEVTFSFDVKEDGQYYVWMRYWCENSGSDNFFIGFNDQNINSQYGSGVEISGEAWNWNKVWNGELKAGKNKIKLYRREWGMKIDCFYVTNDPDFVPAEYIPLKEAKEAAEKAFLESRVVEPIGKVHTFDGKYCEIEAEVSASKGVNVIDDKEASGNKAVKMPNPSGYDRDKPEYCNPPHVTLSFEAPSNGRYAVWLRIYAPDGGSDTMWACFDNGTYAKVEAAKKGEYIWQKVVSQELEAGVHTLNFVGREPNMVVDKAIITTNISYVPSGLGDTNGPVTYEYSYPMPSVLPPANQHPRVYFTADDIPRIRENMDSDENAGTMKTYRTNVEATTTGILPEKSSGTNYNGGALGIAEAKALEYVINGDVQRGNEAISIVKNFVSTANYAAFEYNSAGHTIKVIGEVYDWCYPLLDEETKTLFSDMVPVFASSLEVGWPPVAQGAVTGHGTEGQIYNDILAAGIAMYDERPDIYANSAGRIFENMIEPRKFFYKMHMHPQGVHYSAYRFQWEMLCTLLFDAIGYPNVFGEEQEYAMYQYLYTRRPDGMLFSDGDGSWNYATGTYITKHFRSMFLAGNYFKNPYLKKEAQREISNYAVSSAGSNQSLSPVEFLIFNDPSVESRSLSELPLTHYNPSPKGAMVARTGWEDGFDSPAVVAEMKINEYWTANHQHLDAGAFQIYYKGLLAGDMGYYQGYRPADKLSNNGNSEYGSQHWYNYYRRTIAHNSMLVYDPDEKIGGASYTSNDGGQRIDGEEVSTLEQLLGNDGRYRTGEVLGHEYGLDPIEPNYSYLKGDISQAYSSKVQNFERSFMFLNLKNEEHPAAILVFDRVISSNKDFKKTWLCNGMYEPEINGNRTVFTNTGGTNDGSETYNGKLTIDTLLPASAAITKVGGEGHQHEVNGVNWFGLNSSGSVNEGEGWRVEISPSNANEKDYFLNVMQVGDADGAEALPVTAIETDKVAGAVVADRVVVFGKDRDRTKDNVEFSFGGEGSYEITVADLEAGTWSVMKNGSKIADAVVTEDGGVAVFNGEAGSYILSYANDNSVREEIAGTVKESEGILVRVNNRFIYSDVEPVTVNDRTLIPMRAIFEKLGVDVTWDEATATATAKSQDGQTVVITENSTTAYINNRATELDVPAMIIDGRFVVPIRFVSEAFGATVEWQEYGKIVSIKPGSMVSHGKNISGEIGAITIKGATQSGDDGTGSVIAQSFDNDLTTRWAAEGKDGAAWGVYDLGKVYNLRKVMLSYHNGDSRVYAFDIAVSKDGTNYTNVISGGKSSGKTNELESYDLGGAEARYVKYIGHGSTANLWNSITEIVFINDVRGQDYAQVSKASSSWEETAESAPALVLDDDLNTLWSAEGEQYVDFEFDREYSVSDIEVIFNPNSNRTAMFEVYASNDGKAWTLVRKGLSDSQGDGTKWETFAFDTPVKAKYMRYLGKGSDKSMWNGVKEIRFKAD